MWSPLEKARVSLYMMIGRAAVRGGWLNAAMKLLKLVIIIHRCTFCAADINCRIDILGIV